MIDTRAPERPEDRDEEIRALAYQLWQSEGQPDGQADRHWFMAIEMLVTGVVGMLPSAPTDDPHWLKRQEEEGPTDTQPMIVPSGREAAEPLPRPTKAEIERNMKRARAI